MGNLFRRTLQKGLLVGGLMASVGGCGVLPSVCDESQIYDNGFKIDNREDCEAADGVWKRWGLFPEEKCNIRAGDYGMSCGDSCQCEGDCISECADSDCNSIRGVCSEYRVHFGCTRYWSNGFPSPVICTDWINLLTLRFNYIDEERG